MKKAIEDALNSPLLNDNDIFNSKKILLSISFAGSKDGQQSLMMEEMNDVNDFMAKFGNDFEIKWGLATDIELGKKVKVTILATGFGIESIDGMGSHLKKQSQEDINRIAAEQEKAAERQDRRNRYMAARAPRSATSAVRTSTSSVPKISTTTMSSPPSSRRLPTSEPVRSSTASTPRQEEIRWSTMICHPSSPQNPSRASSSSNIDTSKEQSHLRRVAFSIFCINIIKR